MPDWTDRYSWKTPKDRWITARLPNGEEIEVGWNPLIQSWQDRDDQVISSWVDWREIDVATD